MLNIKLMRYYVYVIMDTTAEWNEYYRLNKTNIHLKYKPIYIGRGCGDRYLSHINKSHNPRVKNLINENKDTIIIKKIINDISWIESVSYEQYLIYHIGRLDLQTGPLYNDTGGINWNTNRLVNINDISDLNLEVNKVNMLLKRLNKYDNKRLAAESLGISERTLYRMCKDYSIVKVKDDEKIKYIQYI